MNKPKHTCLSEPGKNCKVCELEIIREQMKGDS